MHQCSGRANITSGACSLTQVPATALLVKCTNNLDGIDTRSEQQLRCRPAGCSLCNIGRHLVWLWKETSRWHDGAAGPLALGASAGQGQKDAVEAIGATAVFACNAHTLSQSQKVFMLHCVALHAFLGGCEGMQSKPSRQQLSAPVVGRQAVLQHYGDMLQRDIAQSN